MLSYYEKLIDYWMAGKVWDALKYFKQWKKEGLLSKEEIEKLNGKIPELAEQIIEEFQENPNALLELCERVKEVTGWDDEMTFNKLIIIKKNIEFIQSSPLRPKTVIIRIMHEFIEEIISK